MLTRIKIFTLCLLLDHYANGQIALYVTDRFDSRVIQGVKKYCKKIYHIEVDSIGEFSKPEKRPWGYEAADFIICMNEMKVDYYKAVGLTADTIGRFTLGWYFDFELQPIYIPIFGHTNEDMRYSIISSAMDSSYQYTISTALHEIGHLLTLMHCDNEKCIMYTYGPNNSLTLCKRCRKHFRHADKN